MFFQRTSYIQWFSSIKKKKKSVSSVWLCPSGKFINTLNSNPHPTVMRLAPLKVNFVHAPPCLARVTHTSQKEADKARSCKRQWNKFKHLYFLIFLFSFFYLSDVNEAHHGSADITSKKQKIGSLSPRSQPKLLETEIALLKWTKWTERVKLWTGLA